MAGGNTERQGILRIADVLELISDADGVFVVAKGEVSAGASNTEVGRIQRMTLSPTGQLRVATCDRTPWGAVANPWGGSPWRRR